MVKVAFRRNIIPVAVMIVRRWTSAVMGPLVALIIAVSPAHADAHLAPSTDFIRSLADRAIDTLTDSGITTEARRDKFRDLFREGFAINGIARFVLGRHWRGASDVDRTEYLVLFEDCVVNTWADRFSEYSGQKFTVDDAVNAPSAHQAERVAIVRSKFFTDPRTPIRIDWRVANRGDIYKITDVSVEGISMANTQRDEFSSVIRSNRGEISALLEILRKKRDG
jgi:phospholipid transport system substrate-binding protein